MAGLLAAQRAHRQTRMNLQSPAVVILLSRLATNTAVEAAHSERTARASFNAGEYTMYAVYEIINTLPEVATITLIVIFLLIVFHWT